jgi:hypothetical protein
MTPDFMLNFAKNKCGCGLPRDVTAITAGAEMNCPLLWLFTSIPLTSGRKIHICSRHFYNNRFADPKDLSVSLLVCVFLY